MFFLSFRSGQSPNEETGFMEFDNNTQYVDGFYSVTEVTNTFKDGQFIQNLKSFKDTMSQHASNAINGSKLKEAVDKTGAGSAAVSSAVEVVTNDSSVTPPNPLVLGNSNFGLF